MSDTCLNCSDRKPLCHDSCKRYAKMKQERLQINKKHRQYMDGWGHDGCLAPKSGKIKKMIR